MIEVDSFVKPVDAKAAMAEPTRFVRFLITGGIAAGINISARWLFDFVVSYEMAVALSYLVGMTTAFFLARTFVFQPASGRAERQYARFALVNVVGFAQVWITSVGLARFMFPLIGFNWHAETVAHVIGVISPVATSYIGHKRFSFSA
jgi:putative flippase GtrA